MSEKRISESMFFAAFGRSISRQTADEFGPDELVSQPDDQEFLRSMGRNLPSRRDRKRKPNKKG